MNNPSPELLFVYNADSDIFSQVTDFAHKIFAPQTYSCQLCGLTYGNFAIKKQWRDFLQTISYPKTFLHRDDFIRRFPDSADLALPIIFLVTSGQRHPLITAKEIQSFSNLEELISALQKRIATLE